MTSDLWLDQALAQNRRPLPPFEPGEEFDVTEFTIEDVDEVFIIWQPLNVVFWPMVLHRHDQECGRG